jgi:DNA-binding NtrC family response regulator
MDDTEIKVLLVDDETDLVAYLEKRLKKRGFVADAVCAGRDALVLAESTNFDVAVVDLKMPEMDGLEVLQGLKKIQPFMQVIVLTGHGSLETAHQSGAQEAFRYLEKPHEFRSLVNLLRAAHQVKRAELLGGYQEEMERLLKRRGTSPNAILTESKRLQEKYEQ